ncbi:hypothetical protein A2V82_13590 [candidate division KSB1 bacterium RBG_16_48_16]|nr:MAG: hypothetical protein A2V82_13590 [candidate division KSB1 bacterium RBG_16_48_16]
MQKSEFILCLTIAEFLFLGEHSFLLLLLLIGALSWPLICLLMAQDFHPGRCRGLWGFQPPFELKKMIVSFEFILRE